MSPGPSMSSPKIELLASGSGDAVFGGVSLCIAGPTCERLLTF